MTNTLFDDAWQSLEWADIEAKALQSEIDTFRNGKPYAVVAEGYPDNSGGEITLTISGRPDLVLWSRRCGDIVTYLRAALNYACYQIALLDCAGEANRVEFPIFDNPGLFQQNNRINRFAQNRFHIIESVQPYPGRAQELWWLHNLARFHRHRLIRPVDDTIRQIMRREVLVSGDLDDITWDAVPITPAGQDKFIVGRWHNARPAETQVDVQPNTAVEIVIDDPLVRHEPLPVLTFKMREVAYEVLVALEQTLP